MNNAIFFHAGCPVCISAEQQFVAALNPEKYRVEVVHLGNQKSRVAEAEKLGVKSVPALVENCPGRTGRDSLVSCNGC